MPRQRGRRDVKYGYAAGVREALAQLATEFDNLGLSPQAWVTVIVTVIYKKEDKKSETNDLG